MCSKDTPQPAAFIANLRAPMPLSRKLKLLGGNFWIKVSKHRTCCGHPGEPGC